MTRSCVALIKYRIVYRYRTATVLINPKSKDTASCLRMCRNMHFRQNNGRLTRLWDCLCRGLSNVWVRVWFGLGLCLA